MIALGPAETDIGAALRQADAADAFAARVPHRHAGIAQHGVGAGPDIACPVGAHAVGMAIDGVHHAISEVAEIDHLAVYYLADMDAAADDVDTFVIGRETDAVAALDPVGRHRDLELAVGVPAIDIRRQFAPDRRADTDAGIAQLRI